MAQKKNSPNTKANIQPAKKTPQVQKQPATKTVKPASNNDIFFTRYGNTLIPIGIGIITFIFFYPCLGNKLTNWDDLGYIITDPLIKDQSPGWLKNIFALSFHSNAGLKHMLSADNPVMGNYHPLTMLLYAIEYHHYGLDPWIYHLDSVILHALCTITVYFFIKKLTRRTVAALVVALLFGIHPMHVESVAWAAGRKDILYGIFFVMSCTAYVNYIRVAENKRTMWYVAALALFILSLLAKSVAVTLPVTFFVMDYFDKRAWSWKLLIEKIPFFAFSLIFGLLSIDAQSEIGALASLDASFTVIERFSLGCYALVTYLWKALIPIGLSNFYPYPLKIGDAMPGIYYICPVIVLGLAFAIWKYARHNRVILFGLAFFVINIVLLLQFIPVGGAIVSDRYGYIPYIGLFVIAGWYVSEYFETPQKAGSAKMALGITLGYCLILGFLTFDRCKDWYDSVTLWKDDIEKHPDAPVGYFYLGQEYFSRYETEANPTEKKMLADSALYLFNQSIAHKPDYVNPIICVAELQRTYGLVDSAKKTYYKVLSIDHKNESALMGLGVVYSMKAQAMGNSKEMFDSAGYCFRTALAIKPYAPEGHSNYANYFDITGQLDSSLKEYGIAISQNPDAYIPYMNRARIFIRQNKIDAAIKDLNDAIVHKPEIGDLYYLRARCEAAKGDKAHALEDVKAAEERKIRVDDAFKNSLR